MAAGTRLAWLVEERKRPSILSKVNDLTVLHEFFFFFHLTVTSSFILEKAYGIM